MDKISWKEKMSSRKFWAAVIACVGAVCAAFGLSDGSIEQIASIIGAFATLIVYILAEGKVDESRYLMETAANSGTVINNYYGMKEDDDPADEEGSGDEESGEAS